MASGAKSNHWVAVSAAAWDLYAYVCLHFSKWSPYILFFYELDIRNVCLQCIHECTGTTEFPTCRLKPASRREATQDISTDGRSLQKVPIQLQSTRSSSQPSSSPRTCYTRPLSVDRFLRICFCFSHLLFVLRSDCVDILTQCGDMKRFHEGQTPERICELLSPIDDPERCIPLHRYLSELAGKNL